MTLPVILIDEKFYTLRANNLKQFASSVGLAPAALFLAVDVSLWLYDVSTYISNGALA